MYCLSFHHMDPLVPFTHADPFDTSAHTGHAARLDPPRGPGTRIRMRRGSADLGRLSGGVGQTAVRAQTFNADGTKFGSEFLVNTTTTNEQSAPTITTLADGHFVVAWQVRIQGAPIHGQRRPSDSR